MRGELNELAVFAVVAEERSFTRAGARLGLSQSAVSHMMRALEAKLGLELLARTTRSVSPTVVGAALLEGLGPALDQIEQSIATARNTRDQPIGKVRVVMSQAAARLVLFSKLTKFAQTYPQVELDITSSAEAIDLIAENYDAGIHIGEFIERDMIAVRVSGDLTLAVVGSPEYFRQHKRPRNPNDLKNHLCIALRLRRGTVYRWEFQKGERSLSVHPHGSITCSDPDLAVEAALQGLGLVMILEALVAPLIREGRLTRVLSEWCPSFPGYFLYYPSRRNQPAALKALIDTLRI